MILPVSRGSNLNIYNNSTELKNVHAVGPKLKTSQISFGVENRPLPYSWHSSFEKICDNNQKIRGNNIEDAFTNLYKIIQNDLKRQSIEEAAKREAHKSDGFFKSTFVHERLYNVNLVIPISEEKFVRATSGFVREHGIKPNLIDPKAAIKNFIENKLRIAEPTGFFEKWFAATEYSIHYRLLSWTHDLMEKGLIVVANLK